MRVQETINCMRRKEENIRIKKESNMFNSLNQKNPKIIIVEEKKKNGIESNWYKKSSSQKLINTCQ